MLDRCARCCATRATTRTRSRRCSPTIPPTSARCGTASRRCATFRSLPEAGALAAANKRIQNILRKSGPADGADFALLQLPEERKLHESLTAVTLLANRKYAANDFAGTLTALAAMRSDVDAFFDKVLVNAEDPKLRAARLGLLAKLGQVMNMVADISKLSA